MEMMTVSWIWWEERRFRNSAWDVDPCRHFHAGHSERNSMLSDKLYEVFKFVVIIKIINCLKVFITNKGKIIKWSDR